MKNRKPSKESGDNRTIGKWILSIAGIILCINMICRIVDAGETREYVQVTGIVTFANESSEWRAGKRSYSYNVGIEYQPQGYLTTEYITESYSFNLFSKGDAVPVLYRKDAVYDAYVAKKDWVTGAYLPVSKSYNVPLIIAFVLFVIGILFYTNSPVLDWYCHMGEIVIGKQQE